MDAGRWERPCLSCYGDGCEECNSEGWFREAESPELDGNEGDELFQSYRWLREYRILPEPGGLNQQHPKFIQAVDLCDTLYSIMYQRKQSQSDKAKKLQAQISKSLGGKRGR